MKFVRVHQGEKVKDLRIEYNEYPCELKLTWKDEQDVRCMAWIPCSTLRRTVFSKKAK